MPTTSQAPVNPTPAPQPSAGGGPQDLGRLLVWPLFVGGLVLAIGWAAWQINLYGDPTHAISVAASGLAAVEVGVLAIAILVNAVSAAFAAFPGLNWLRNPALDYAVPVGVVAGFLLGLAAWQ